MFINNAVQLACLPSTTQAAQRYPVG